MALDGSAFKTKQPAAFCPNSGKSHRRSGQPQWLHLRRLLMEAEEPAAAAGTCLSPACWWSLQQQMQEREVEGRWYEHGGAKGWRKEGVGRKGH